MDFLYDMTEEEARTLWKWGGFADHWGAFPGIRVGIMRMVEAVTTAARRNLAKFFATLAPHAGRTAVVALLRARVPNLPRWVPTPISVPLRMTSQRQRSAVTPTRGSPRSAGVGAAPT